MLSNNKLCVSLQSPEMIRALMELVRHSDRHEFDKDCIGSVTAALIPADVRDLLRILNQFQDAGYITFPEPVVVTTLAQLRASAIRVHDDITATLKGVNGAPVTASDFHA